MLPGADTAIPAWAPAAERTVSRAEVFGKPRYSANNAAPLYFAALAEISTDMYIQSTGFVAVGCETNTRAGPQIGQGHQRPQRLR